MGLSKDVHPEGGITRKWMKMDMEGEGGFWNTLNTEYLEAF